MLTAPYVPSSSTSHQAAAAIQPHLDTIEGKVYAALLASPDGATDAELVARLGLASNTVGPRRRELVLKGRVVDSGLRRAGPGGGMARVWLALDSDEPVEPGPTPQPLRLVRRRAAMPHEMPVLGLLIAAGHYGATDDEMQESLGLGGAGQLTQRRARCALVQAGLAMPDPWAAPRRTRSGALAQVWVASAVVLGE